MEKLLGILHVLRLDFLNEFLVNFIRISRVDPSLFNMIMRIINHLSHEINNVVKFI